MRTDTKVNVTRLADYTPPPFLIEDTHLDFDLYPDRTVVIANLTMRRNGEHSDDLVLDGEELELLEIAVDGETLAKSRYKVADKSLTVKNLPDSFTLTTKSICVPSANTRLMGLYLSGGRFCTQCEAEGFRRITWYLDRPDVLSKFTVRMAADKSAYPSLLANGNRTDYGELDGGRHFAVWEDPFLKPCYLFALVAGQFDMIEDSFTTMSGRDIRLEIYVDPGDADAAWWAMDSLKRSMEWDEEVFGREYDLDLFMIVAVRDFNFGAMENKGLNIFNSAYILARPETATDYDYEAIESVVAHEYFHNWTGNRITCRDWFQLSLKEGLTVFRDQEFSADMRGRPLQRIKDVKRLRASQFPEDQGPLAHPVRPATYMKIDNFYTATIYNKGAEVIRMLKTLIGPEKFREGMDLYFKRWDGHATTIETFVQCFADVTDFDMDQWMRWYEQAGTPIIEAEVKDGKLHLSQSIPATPGQKSKKPVIMPIRYSVLNTEGEVLAEDQINLDKATAEISLKTTANKPVVSLLEGFSVPAILKQEQSAEDLSLVMSSGPDLFNRWEAGQTLAKRIQLAMIEPISNGQEPAADPDLAAYSDSLASILANDDIDPGFRAVCLGAPGFGDLTQALDDVDPLAVVHTHKWLRGAVAGQLKSELKRQYSAMTDDGAFSPSPEAANRRSLKNMALDLLSAADESAAEELALMQFDNANNMTDELSALAVLLRLNRPSAQGALARFYDKWSANPLVMDKWFALQAREGTFEQVKALTAHEDFDISNPNRVRAVIGNFAMGNPKAYHRPDGASYAFFADMILKIDPKNPALAARLLNALDIRPKLQATFKSKVDAELKRILAASPSKNVLEIGNKLLKSG